MMQFQQKYNTDGYVLAPILNSLYGASGRNVTNQDQIS